jgi:uracil-DNA glycosylase
LANEYQTFECYPARQDVFNAFKYCGPKDVKVVVIGQDPYINPGQAHGLAFSVMGGQLPPSLINIFKELSDDLKIAPPRTNGNLEDWSKQGVLLLNSVLTVRQGLSMSHSANGWEEATDEIIKTLSESNPKIVYLLWGNFAKTKKPLVKNSLAILEAAHPSPLSSYKGWFGCKHFSKTNEVLESAGVGKIDWVGKNE